MYHIENPLMNKYRKEDNENLQIHVDASLALAL